MSSSAYRPQSVCKNSVPESGRRAKWGIASRVPPYLCWVSSAYNIALCTAYYGCLRLPHWEAAGRATCHQGTNTNSQHAADHACAKNWVSVPDDNMFCMSPLWITIAGLRKIKSYNGFISWTGTWSVQEMIHCTKSVFFKKRVIVLKFSFHL